MSLSNTTIYSLEYFDIAIIVPLEEELHCVFDIFPSIEDRSTDTELQHVVDCDNPNLKVLVTHQQEMGRKGASQASRNILLRYDVGLFVCLGIAGGLSTDLRLGDVCYSGSVIDVYDNASVFDRDAGGSQTRFSPSFYSTPNDITAALNFMRTQPLPQYQRKYFAWQTSRAQEAKNLIPNNIATREGGEERLDKPNTMNGAIICGAVSKSEEYNAQLKLIDRKALAIETESGGIFAEAGTKSIPVITIRGISDYADKSKSTLEHSSKGVVRKLAASNAASFLQLQMSNPAFEKVLQKRKMGRQASLAFSESDIIKSDIISQTVMDISNDIDSSLRKLSPEYKLHPRGYRLPLPRISKNNEVTDSDINNMQTPIDIRDALTQYDRLLISLPRTYPDHSIAWVLAHDLLTYEISGKQVLPIVVDGKDIKWKSNTFALSSETLLESLTSLSGIQLLFIIDDIQLENKHKINILLEKIKAYQSAKFIFVARCDSKLVHESDFHIHTGSHIFNICSISFAQIKYFIQQNFSMSVPEAEVVALRLIDTFETFELDAHPTYFAGIPRETLTALLQANRRSELIQLAVDGFLTFLVAEDRESVTLSRSTRARFLRNLVQEIKVEKIIFDEEKLITFTKEFAKQYDFNINPLSFVKAFIDHNILHFENGQAYISLPFIETYLLASTLSSNAQKAESYFQLDDPAFDLITFDLYAEIGVSTQIIEDIIQNLYASAMELKCDRDEQHILLSEKLSPSNFRRPDRAEALRARLKKAAEAVRLGTDNAEEKQKILDTNEKILSAVAQSTIPENNDTKIEDNDTFNPLSLACHRWVIATVLLGSGAEHLDAQVKRKIISLIIDVAGHIIDAWSRLQQQIDFKEIRDNLTREDFLYDLPADDEISDKKRMVNTLIDLIEHEVLAAPLRRVIGFLCEQARHRVLAVSVENAQSEGQVNRIIHGTWLADIDSRRGKKMLHEAIKELPSAPFLRVTLAHHYLSRVYWSHWQKEDRLMLLDAAQEVIKPLDVQLKKSELKRIIERSQKTTDSKER